MGNKKYENRLVYAALILVLTVLATLVIVAGVASRRARPGDGIESTAADTAANDVVNRETAEHDPDVTLPKPNLPGIKDDDKNKDKDGTSDETKTPSASVDAPSEPPEFTAPANGAVAKGHSETVLVYSMTMNDYRTHSGVDIAVPEGEGVRAAAAGVIDEVWEDPMWGYCVSICHEGDSMSIYRNLSRESFERLSSGDEVEAGDLIGSVGDTALCELADEAHLHFELRIGGVAVDPEDYIIFATDDVFAD